MFKVTFEKVQKKKPTCKSQLTIRNTIERRMAFTRTSRSLGTEKQGLALTFTFRELLNQMPDSKVSVEGCYTYQLWKLFYLIKTSNLLFLNLTIRAF